MSSVKVEGVGRFDGTYDLGDNDRVFNGREWHWIKKISGYMPGTIADGFAGQDPDLFFALAVIAMVRSGKLRRELALDAAEEMLEAPYTASTVTLIGDLDEGEDEAIPPSSGSENDGSLANGSLSNDDTKTPNGTSSGPNLTSVLAASEEIPSPTTA